MTERIGEMSVEECYELCEGNYKVIKNRLLDDKRIKKFLGMFTRDDSFEKLTQALQTQDYKEGFKAAHTIKGVAQNLAFTAYASIISELTEKLRSGEETEDIMPLYEQAKEKYETITAAIQQLQKEG